MTTGFLFEVDWNNDRDFNDHYEDVTAYVMAANWQLGMGDVWQNMADESSCEWTLTNPNYLFNPGDAIGTAGGTVDLQRRMRIRHITSGGTITLWNGWLDHFEISHVPQGTVTGQTEIKIVGTGPKQYLQDTDVSLPTYYNTTTDVIIRAVLNQAQLPATAGSLWLLGVPGYSELGVTTRLADESAYADLNTGYLTLSKYGQDTTTKAWDIISEVVDAEVGLFYIARDGRATFLNRTNAFISTAPAGTIADSDPYKKPVMVDYSYGTDVQNIIRAEGNQRYTDADDTILYKLNGAVGVAAGGTVEFIAPLRKVEGRDISTTGVVVQNAHYYAGTGTLSVIANGPDVKVKMVGGTAGGTVDYFELVGPATYTQNALAVEVRNTTTIALYGRRAMDYSVPALSVYAEIKAFADFKLAVFQYPRKQINRVTMVGSDTELSHRVQWGMGTITALQYPRYNLASPNDNYRIIGEDHDWKPGVHQVTWTLRLASEGGGGGG